jgi:tetratricopeptide (TPR) repeat protein
MNMRRIYQPKTRARRLGLEARLESGANNLSAAPGGILPPGLPGWDAPATGRPEARPAVSIRAGEPRSNVFSFAPRLVFRALMIGLVLAAPSAPAASKKDKARKVEPVAATSSASPAAFAPMDTNQPLAAVWNDADFARRLVGSYGFAPDIEPRMTPGEQAVYRDKVVPALRENPRQALPILESLVKPDATAVFDFTLGNIYFQNEDLTNAVRHFQAALAKFPDYRRAQKNLGFALVRDGKFREAVEPLSRTITLGGADGKVLGLLAFAHASQGRHISAEAAYRQALVYEPENLEFQLGLVRCSVATANYDGALALLDELLQRHPERDTLWNLQAGIHIQKEQPAQAAISLEILRRLGKATPQNLYLLGDLYMTREARDLALESYREALDKDGGQNAAKALRAAQILASRGAWNEARELLAKIRAAGAVPGPADELKLLKLEARAAMASGEGEKAIATIEQISLKDPLDAEALLLAGDYYAKTGQREKAEFRYKTAAGIEGYEADACVKHAQLLVQSQNYASAVELLRKAQKAKPRDNVQRYLEKVEQLARTSRS